MSDYYGQRVPGRPDSADRTLPPTPPQEPQAPATWYVAPPPTPKRRIALIVAGVVGLLVLVSVPGAVASFNQQRDKALAERAADAAPAVLRNGRVPTCQPADGVTSPGPGMTCAPNAESDALRAAVMAECTRSDGVLTREWWQPQDDEVAFFHAHDAVRADWVTMPAGAISCG